MIAKLTSYNAYNNVFGVTVYFLVQGDLDTGQSRSLDSQADSLVGFSNALLHRKDPSAAQRQVNYHLAPPNPAFPPGNARAFPPQYPVSRLPYRISHPQHPGMAQQNQQQQQQLSPAYTGGSHNTSFFSGAIPPHRAVQSPTLDGPESGGVEEMSSSIRTSMVHPGGHHPGLSQHNRVNSFGEDVQDGSLGESLGE